MSAGLPAEFQRGQKIAQLFAVEDHAAQDAVHKSLQGGRFQPMFLSNRRQLLRVFFSFKNLIAFPNLLLRQALVGKSFDGFPFAGVIEVYT